MDGVRLNQPFGEVVSWDLIPRIAISSTHADAGLESAVRAEHARRRAVDPDQGRPHASGHHRAGDLRQRRAPGARVRARRQTAGRRASTGISPAICSPRTAGATTRRPTCGRSSARSAGSVRRGDVTVSVAYADNSLTGNGLQEHRLLDRDYASVYTKPDTTDNRSTFAQRHGAAPLERPRCRCLGERLLPRHPHEHAQRRHQRGRRSTRRSISRARPNAPRSPRRDTPAFPASGENATQHAVPVLALHRQRAAERRAGREVQRPDQPDAHRRSTTAACRAR